MFLLYIVRILTAFNWLIDWLMALPSGQIIIVVPECDTISKICFSPTKVSIRTGLFDCCYLNNICLKNINKCSSGSTMLLLFITRSGNSVQYLIVSSPVLLRYAHWQNRLNEFQFRTSYGGEYVFFKPAKTLSEATVGLALPIINVWPGDLLFYPIHQSLIVIENRQMSPISDLYGPKFENKRW